MANPQIVKGIILFTAVLVFALQVTALAEPKAYVKIQRHHVNWRLGGYSVHDCGMFECKDSGHSFRDNDVFVHNRFLGDEPANHMKAACAFGVIAAVLMGLMMIFHALLLPPSTLGAILQNRITSLLAEYMWVWHVIAALCCLISWALLAAHFDRWLKTWYDLQHGFAFLIMNMVFELVLAFACFKHIHTQGTKEVVMNTPSPQPVPYDYDGVSPNPIDRAQFPQRNSYRSG